MARRSQRQRVAQPCRGVHGDGQGARMQRQASMDAQTMARSSSVAFQAAYAGGSSGRVSRLRRACATCGWSRWTRHSGGPEHPWAQTNGRSQRSSDRAFDMSAGLPAADSLNQHLSPIWKSPPSHSSDAALTKRFRKDPSFASVRRTSIKDEGDRSGEIHHFGIPVFPRVDPAWPVHRKGYVRVV